jgi:hypothetical protein
VPEIDVSQWSVEAMEQERATLAERGAEPVLTLAWLSRAEIIQRERDAADDARCAALRAQAVKGANRIRYQR